MQGLVGGVCDTMFSRLCVIVTHGDIKQFPLLVVVFCPPCSLRDAKLARPTCLTALQPLL